MRARLADARFFFEEDKKVPLDERVEKLAGIVFHNRLGTVREKVERIEKLAEQIARSDRLVRRDARARGPRGAPLQVRSRLADGRRVPRAPGHDGARLRARRGRARRGRGRRPRSLPPDRRRRRRRPDDVSRIVALADRLDTLVGCFAVGLQPTGAADPFALRRACIGILRTLIEEAPAAFAKIRFGAIATFAHGLFAGKKLDLDAAATTAALEAFATRAPPRPHRIADEQARGRRGARGLRVGSTARALARPASPRSRSPKRARSSARSTKRPRGSTRRARSRSASPASAKKRSPSSSRAPSSSNRPDAAIVDVVDELDRKTRELTTRPRRERGALHDGRARRAGRSHLQRDARERPGRPEDRRAPPPLVVRSVMHAPNRRLHENRLIT